MRWNQPAPSGSGQPHAADPTDTNFEHCQELLERQQEHLETLKSILPDVKTRPSDSRIRELAERFKVPEQVDEQFLPLDLVFKSVQQQFQDEVCALQSKSRTMSSTSPAVKKARVATAVHTLPVSLATASDKAPAAARHVDKPAALAKNPRDVSEVASSGGAHSAASSDNQPILWLVLAESRYDAIASGHLRWEARPRDGAPPFNWEARPRDGAPPFNKDLRHP